jgi:aldehyde:ferredoxin oxidoreductase
MGPVTPTEYESRTERYDNQLKNLGYDITSKKTEEKMALLRKHREERYANLQDAVYKERGWSQKGCPTIEKIKKLGIDYEDVIKFIKPHQ